MSENFNSITPDDAQNRANRINAIRNAVNYAGESDDNDGYCSYVMKPVAFDKKNVVKRSGQQVRNAAAVNNASKKKKKTLGQKFRELFPEKQDSLLERMRKLVFLGSIIAIVVCGYMVGDYYLDLWKSGQINDNLVNIYVQYGNTDDSGNGTGVESEKYYHMLDGARKLLDINPDVIGFITIPDTPVQYPVVKGRDNDEYLHKNFYGQTSRAGTIFVDYRTHYDEVAGTSLAMPNSDNIVIYGHNMADGSMFGTLEHYNTDYSYYGQHPIIEFNSNYDNYKYKIFSVLIADAKDESETKYDCWNKLYFNDENEFYDFVNEAKKRTLILNDVDVQYGDKIITLSTCNYVLNDRSRLIIMARLVRDGEDLYEGTQNNSRNNNVKWPSLYYQSHGYTYDPNAEFVPYGPAKSEEIPAEPLAEQAEGVN